jgi:type I restriction enzyme S subunit
MKAQELRNAVLQLAIQGKLVPQDPNEESVSVFLNQIKAEKEQLIRDRKIKRENPLSEIIDDEKPFDIPDSWVWVRLAEVVQLINGDRGKNYPSKDKLSNEGIPFISAINIQDGKISTNNLLCVSQEQYEKLGSGKLRKNDVVFCIRGSLGKNGIFQFDKGAIASSLVILRRYDKVNNLLNYLFSYLNSPLLFTEMKKYNNGTAQPNLSAENLKNFLLPLPPLAEQQRIVAKIEEIMPKIDAYEKLEQELSALEKRHPNDLKKSILQYAVQGKLVPQTPADEPASMLIEKIKAEKEQLIKEKKIKFEKPLPEITDDEKPFDVPDNWNWVRLGELGIVQTGTTPDTTNPDYFGCDIPFIKPGDITNSHIDYDNESLSHLGLSKGRLIESYSILMVCIGGSTGKCYFTNIDVSCNQQINTITPYKGASYKYLFYLLSSDYFYKNVIHKATGTATPIINKSSWSSIPFPLPPLAEQERIVAKVDDLIKLCDILADEKALSDYKPRIIENKVIPFPVTAYLENDEEDYLQAVGFRSDDESIDNDKLKELQDVVAKYTK